MRVTNKMLTNHAMTNLYGSLKRLDKMNSELSSGTKIQRPSDDPVGTTVVMRLKSSLRQIGEHKANVDNAIGVTESIDSALAELGDVLQRASELATRGANGTLDQTARDAIAKEVDQLLDHVVQVGNSTFAGRHVFGYNRTDKPPFSRDGDNIYFLGKLIDVSGTGDPSGDGSTDPVDGTRTGLEVGVGSTIDVSVPGDKAFGPAISSLLKLKKALQENGDVDAVISDIQDAMETSLQYRSEIGAKMKRLQITQERLSDLELSTKTLLADTEGVDVAEAIMNLKMEENAYQLALSVNARIIQPTLMDFLN